MVAGHRVRADVKCCAEADLHIRPHQSDAHLLRAIEAALARITQDRFGVCEMCSSPISKARLEAVPWTRLCRDCKEREQPLREQCYGCKFMRRSRSAKRGSERTG